MVLKKSLYYPLSFLIFLCIFYIFSNASISGLFYPFSFAFMFALIWANQKPYIVCPAYLIASILYDYSFNNIISVICCVFMILVPYYIHILLKRNLKIWELGIYAGLSQLAKILLSYFSGGQFYLEIISMVLGILFMYISIIILEAIFVRGVFHKLTVLELIGGGAFLMAFSNGLTPLILGPFSFLKLFVAFTILVIAYCSKSYYAVFTSVILGFGSLLSINNPVYIAPFIIWSISISLFKSYKKYLMPVALILAECLSGFYFNLYYNFSPWEIAPVVVASLIFILIPSKTYDKLRSLFKTKSSRGAIKDVVNRNREVLTRRISSLGEVFGEMDRVFRKMAQASLTENEIKEVMKRELKKKVCENCAEKNRCYRTYCTEMEEVLNEISKIALDKGRISVLDLPGFLNTHCTKATSIISAVNTLCDQYKRYSELVGDVDKSKLLIADQLLGISGVMKKLSKEIETPMSFDAVREQKIMEELLFHEVVCDDVIVFEKGIHTQEATLVVRNEDKLKTVIPQVVGKICGNSMAVQEIISVRPGWSTLSIKTAPKYDCAFGISVKTKTGSVKSGDCHSILKLDSDKFMFALCDGMGSGEKAEEISETAISLLENFYKAGFESDLILSSVNKFLSLQRDEAFSAIDICILDLKNAVVDFIKMGSPCSYLVGKDKCQVIEGGALPLGVIKESAPNMKKIATYAGDFIILLTDGISDSFENDEEMTKFICSITEKNPQKISDEILNHALEINQGNAKDDMSVLVIKIF